MSAGAGDDCARHREIAAELALGLVTGQERAEALAHLERCPACRDEVAALAGVHDRLRALIPPVPAPLGFEQRVLERIGAPAPRSRWPRWSRIAAAAVLVCAVVGAAFAGGWATGSRPVASEWPAVAAPLVVGTQQVGNVVVSRDRPNFLSVYLEVARPGKLTCELLRGDGSVAATETYDARTGTDWWGVPRPPGDVAAIRVADDAGAIVANGRVPPL